MKQEKPEKIIKKLDNDELLIEHIYSNGQKLYNLCNLFDEYVYLIKGKAKIIYNGCEYFLKKGDFIKIEKNIKHDVFNLSRLNIWLCVHKKYWNYSLIY